MWCIFFEDSHVQKLVFADWEKYVCRSSAGSVNNGSIFLLVQHSAFDRMTIGSNHIGVKIKASTGAETMLCPFSPPLIAPPAS
jgi:hypothetical protein